MYTQQWVMKKSTLNSPRALNFFSAQLNSLAMYAERKHNYYFNIQANYF